METMLNHLVAPSNNHYHLLFYPPNQPRTTTMSNIDPVILNRIVSDLDVLATMSKRIKKRAKQIRNLRKAAQKEPHLADGLKTTIETLFAEEIATLSEACVSLSDLGMNATDEGIIEFAHFITSPRKRNKKEVANEGN